MPMDLHAYRGQSREIWDEMAPGWEALRSWLMEASEVVNRWIIDRAGLKSGESVLDIAAGTGDLGFMAAERVGAEGRVLSTDFSPEMVEVARRHGSVRNASNVEFAVLDAERMDLDDASFDAVVCRWGYMLMADPAAALSESRRVLREGGRLSFAVWTTADRNPWAGLPAMTLVHRGLMPAPEPGAPGIFALGEAQRLEGLVAGAGFAAPEREEIEFEWLYPDENAVWENLTRIAGPLARVINALRDDERHATREAVFTALADFRAQDGSYTIPASCWGVLAR